MGLPIAAAIAGLTIAVSLLCAAVPAWNAARADFSPFIRGTSSPRPRAWRLRSALVIAQIALSCVLLIGAGLLTRTMSVLLRDDPGFHAGGGLEAKLVLSDVVLSDDAGRRPFVPMLLERIRALPGVEHAGFGTNLPPRNPPLLMSMRFVDAEGRGRSQFMKVGSATPGYLRALGARFVAGRDFTDADVQSGAPVVVLSESAARFCFGAQDAIGRNMPRLPAMFRVGAAPRVIGVVGDVKYEGLDSPASSAVYLPWSLRPFGSGYVIVRTAAGDPLRYAADIRRIAQSIDPAVPVPEVQSLGQALAQSIASRRARALPAVGFGVLALGVAFVGVLATLSTLVAERRRDLAIRSALGASRGRLTWTIVGRGLALTAVGLLLGLGLGTAAARGLSSLVYGVSPFDAVTFAGTAIVIGGGAALMTYMAARRTHAVDPLSVLKSE
jgi:predicted permease